MGTVVRSAARSRFAIPVLFIFVTLIVFLTQTGSVGFWGHNHGWVSSHSLAVMSRATPENLFVGHAITDHSADGHIGYIYFERYPFFIAALIGNLIRITSDLGMKIFLARQVMLVLFVLTMITAYFLVKKLLKNRWLAFSAVALAFSGYYLIFFRDMIHYDQPALLGMMVLLLAITDYKLEGRRRWLIPATLVAVGLGRGYASFAILGLWFLFESLGLLISPALPLHHRLIRILKHDSTRILVIGLLWGVALLSYNIAVEALRRDVSIENTSVIESARRRLPFGYEEGRNLITSGNPPPPWGEFTHLEADRMLRWFAPVKVESSDEAFSPAALPVAFLALAAIAIFAIRQTPAQRTMILLTAFSSLLWVFFMINLTAEHDYTTMYLLGFALMAYTALVALLRPFPQLAPGLAVLCLALFLAANARFYNENVDFARSYDAYTVDYNRILHAIDGSQQDVLNTFTNNCIIENSRCYALGFYLGDNYLTRDFSITDYVVTPHVYYMSKPFLEPGDEEGLMLLTHNLTPENTTTNVFDTASAEVRHVPDDAAPMYDFGETFSLQHWTLRDSVTVQPCQQIALESWWQVESQPQVNYSLQIAMVDSEGQSVSEANSDLSILPTKVWVPETYVLDARSLQIPCDAGPGDYPLVMSIYDPETVASEGALPVTLPDGTPFNNYVYLTTLFIEE